VKRAMRAAGELGLNVIRNPNLLDTLAPSIAHPFTSTWKAGQPWWNPRAIRYLAEQLPTGGQVFEWGSGGSTVWFARHGQSVTAVESEPGWAARVRKGGTGAVVRYIPGRDEGRMRSELQLRDHGEHFFDDYVDAVNDYPDGCFDVVVVDGLCRKECARLAAVKVKPGGIVVVDDTNWDFLSECLKPFQGWETRRICGFKYMAAEVAETSFFRRPGGAR
jgi:Methyltransferase domain